MSIHSGLAAALIALGFLSGCISTQEMPLAPNVVRLDTRAQGLLFTGQTVPHTMRTAARATLERGYTHFKFQDAALGQGSVVTGAMSSANVYGGRGYASGFGTTTLMRAPVAGAAVTVVMFRANDPDAKDAFDADQVLRQYSQ